MEIRRSYAPPSIIKNIQHITTTFSSQQNKTIAVASYNQAKTFVSPIGVQIAGGEIAIVSFDSSTQITIGLQSSVTSVVQVDLVEFW